MERHDTTYLFVIVVGVEASGLLDLIGGRLAEMAAEPGSLLITALALALLFDALYFAG